MDAIAIDHQVEVGVPRADLFALLRDPDRYVAIEPCLKTFAWVDRDAPRAGARAHVETEIPFTLAVLRRLIKSPRGDLMVTEWDPPSRVGFRFEASTVDGTGELLLTGAPERSTVQVSVLMRPKPQRLMRFLRPLRARLERMGARAVSRGAARLEYGLVPHEHELELSSATRTGAPCQALISH